MAERPADDPLATTMTIAGLDAPSLHRSQFGPRAVTATDGDRVIVDHPSPTCVICGSPEGVREDGTACYPVARATEQGKWVRSSR